MARIPLVGDRDAGVLGRLAYAFARRRFGEVPEPFAALRHHPRLFWTAAVSESLLERSATEGILPRAAATAMATENLERLADGRSTVA